MSSGYSAGGLESTNGLFSRPLGKARPADNGSLENASQQHSKSVVGAAWPITDEHSLYLLICGSSLLTLRDAHIAGQGLSQGDDFSFVWRTSFRNFVLLSSNGIVGYHMLDNACRKSMLWLLRFGRILLAAEIVRFPRT